MANRRRPLRATTKRMDPFIHCVFGPLSSHGSGSGAPDGSVEPSVVIDHRQTVNVRPDASGNLAVAIVPSPYGCVAIGAGSTVATINTIDTTNPSGLSYSVPTPGLVTNTTYGNYKWPILPFKESIKQSGLVANSAGSGLQATKFRVLTTQAQAEYTGSTMHNSGQAATCKIAHHFSETIPYSQHSTPFPPASNVGVRMAQLPPESFDAVASVAGSRVFPARQSAMIINAPQNFEYQEVRSEWTPFYSSGLSQDVISLFGGATTCITSGGAQDPAAYEPVPGLGNAAITYYAASGLDPSATITFETRTCVEYTLAFESPASRFAALPASPRPSTIMAVKEMGRAIPSSFPVTAAVDQGGWLGNALGWYGKTMASIVGSVYQSGGRMLGRVGPMGAVLGGGAESLGAGLSHLAITG